MSGAIASEEQRLREIWKKMASSLSKQEKKIFNEWRFNLWRNVDRQRDFLRIARVRPLGDLEIIDAIYKQVQEIPNLR